jgi:uncharacterized Tic20 family protein
MVEEKYRIVFYGEVALWSDVDEAKRNIGAMFKVNAATVEKMFAARPAIIKSGLNHETAVRYKMAFEQTGAVCVVEQIVPEPSVRRPASGEVADGQAPAPSDDMQEPTAGKSTVSMTCPKCGQRQPEAAECAKCGIFIDKFRQLQSVPHVDRQEMEQNEMLSEAIRSGIRDERTWAMLCHLAALAGCLLPLGNILGPLAIWLLKKNESSFIDEHGKAALNFQITITLAMILVIPVSLLSITKYVLIPLFAVLFCYWLYVIIRSALAARRGDDADIGPCLQVLR